MALMDCSVGSGAIYGESILGDTLTYISLPAITQAKNNVLIQFYTMSDNFIDSISLFSENETNIGIEFNDDIVGGLGEFTLSLSRNFIVQIFDQMIIKLFVENKHYFTGMIRIKPTNDQASDTIEYKGQGLIYQLEKENINALYESATVSQVLNDLIGNMTTPDIFYDPSKINPPDINIVKLEFNNKSILSCINEVLEICNVDFNNAEYRYYIDVDRFFVFESIDKTNIIDSLFEGYHYQKPGISVNTGKIINQVDIFRSQEDSQQVELIDTISDANSISDYELSSKKITIPDYADIDDATYIARYNIERFKDPIKTIKISNYLIDKPLQFGSYNINNAIREYTKLITDCNRISDWDLFLTNTSISLETRNVQSGRNCFKIETTSGSIGEYIEYTLDEQINFPECLNIWIRQDSPGMFIFFQFYDEYGNTTEYETVPIVSESGVQIVSELGVPIVAESSSAGVMVYLIEQFNKYTIPIDTTQIKSLKKIRITFITENNETIYIDRLETCSRQYNTSNLVLRKAKYKIERGVFTADCQFGELAKTATDDLTELDEKTATIKSIFEKS